MFDFLLIFLLTFSASPQQGDALFVQFNRAVEFQKQGRFEEAVQEYQSIIQQKPDYVEAHANLGVSLARLGKTQAALKAYQTALQLAPQLVRIWLNVGILHYRSNQFEEAIHALDKYLETQPQDVQARQLLGLSLIEIGYNSAAIEQLQPTLTSAPNDAAVLYGLGLAHIRLNKDKEAEEIIQRLNALPTGAAAAHLLRGQLELMRFEFEKAVLNLTQAQQLDESLPRVNYSLGLCYYKLGRNKESLLAFGAESKRRPQDYSTLYYLALLHEIEGDIETAKKWVDAALVIRPDSVEGITVLGKILARQGKNEEAAAALEKAIAQDPKDSIKRYLLGKVYREMGRREDSNREFNEARRLKAEETKTDREKSGKPSS
jgi:tetratricopeptide (TPR) repeat protein